MNVFSSKNIQKAIKKIFKEKSTLVEERKEFVDLIVNIHTDFFREIKSHRERLMKVRSKTQEEHMNILLEVLTNAEEYEAKKNYFIKSEGKKILKEYKEKFGDYIAVDSFQKALKLDFEPTIYKEASYEEFLKYEKEYTSGSFVVDFIYEEYSKNIEYIEILVKEKNGRSLNVIINSETKDEDMKLSLFQIADKNIKLDINSKNEAEKAYLSSLKEEDLLSLDSKEKQEYLSMLFDFKLDLKDEPLYDIFKMGMAEFMNTVKNELKQKTNNKLKGV